jgi:hypothetical protein
MASLADDGRRRVIETVTGVDRFDAIGYLTQWLAVQPDVNTWTNTGTCDVQVLHYPTYP